MKHINKPLGVNFNVIEQANPNRNRKALMEGVNIIILIALGCAGLFLYYNILSPKKTHVPHSGITANTNIVADEQEHHSVPETKVEHSQLLIEGHREAGELITFTIDNYDKKASYIIDFGNGTRKEVKNKKITYSYNRSGNYEVKLSVGYKNEAPVEFSKKIYIDESIEVSESAYEEQ